MDEDRFDTLTDRQRGYLRLVYQHHDTKSIARITGGASLEAIDKQITRATAKLGATSRIEAARMLHDREQGVRSPDVRPPDLSKPAFLPLPMPLPTASRPTNTMDWRQVLAWGAIIAIAAPIALTVAGMLLLTLVQLVAGVRP